MKKLISLVLCLILCCAVYACAEGVEFFTLGETVPDFSVELCDGSVFTLSEALETHDIVMINIWASWCGPCRQEFPYMEDAWNMYYDRVALVCLSCEPTDTNDVIKQFMYDNGLSTLPMGQDTIGLSDIIVQEGYPTTIIVDKFGVYAYYECGSLTSVGEFTRMFDYFLDESYTETVLQPTIPGAKPDVPAPTSGELTAALGGDGIITFCCADDPYAWPFIVTDNGVVSSNKDSATYSVMYAIVGASAGQVLKFDYDVDSDIMDGVLGFSVNDMREAAFTGETGGTYACRVQEDGMYVFAWEYTKEYGPSETSDDIARVSNVQLLSGEAADAAIAAMPVYPRTLEGAQLSVAPVGEDVREIVIDDPSGFLLGYFGPETRYYLVPSDTATIRSEIGADVNPMMAIVYSDYDNIYHMLSNEAGEDAYYSEIWLSSILAGDNYSNTYVYLIEDYTIADNMVMALVFASEEDVNYFCAYDIYDEEYNNVEGVTWMYADGSLPSTDEIADSGYMDGYYEYCISVVDETGAPVTGVMLNVCTDEFCLPSMVDDNGQLIFGSEPYAYSIHVLMVPDGYEFDTSTELIMEGTELTIVMPHK